MGEEVSQGLTRRDLLRRGVVLGGAVIWTTPVVQTLGMGRAFAQTASPVEDGDKDVSYVVISWKCNGEIKKVKWENGEFSTQGNLPDCGAVGGSYSSFVPEGLDVKDHPTNSACVLVDVPKESAFKCTTGAVTEVTAWVKAGSSKSSLDPCHPTKGLALDTDDQQACSST